MSFILLSIFFSFMCVLTLFRHAWATPYPKITPQKPLLLIMLAIVEFILLIGLFKIGLWLAARFEKRYIKIVLIIYIIIQMAFIFLLPLGAYEDALIVEKLARDILQGDFFSLGIGHYLGYYPNNIGITLFFAFLYRFLPQSHITLRLFNVIFTTLSAWLIYKLYKELFPEDKRFSKGVLLFTIFFIPPIIINNFTYGDIFCNTFCLAAMLCAIRYVNRGGLKYALYTAVLLMLANFMRSIALLFMLAVLIYWFVNCVVKNRLIWEKALLGFLVVILLFNLPLRIFSVVGVKTEMLPEPVGIHANPIWRWINIGFPTEKKLGYWDGGKNIAIFVNRFNCNPKEASKFFINDIIQKYRETGRKNVFKCYAKKTFWLWTEGTYSVNFYGLSQAVKAERFSLYKTPLVKYIEPGDKFIRLSLDWLLHTFNWILMLLTILYLISAVRRRDYRLELFVYVIILYIGFYFFWEIKTRYLFGLYPIFLIMAYNALDKNITKLFIKP